MHLVDGYEGIIVCAFGILFSPPFLLFLPGSAAASHSVYLSTSVPLSSLSRLSLSFLRFAASVADRFTFDISLRADIAIESTLRKV